MSHTTTVDSVVFTDIAALRAALAELKSKGINVELLEKSTPRAYYTEQAGMGLADYVVKLNDGRYDVGLYKNDALKGYEARTDLFGGYVAKILGVPVTKGANATQAAMGKLYNTYAVHAATRKAVQQGYTVRRVNNQDGSVRLVLGNIQ